MEKKIIELILEREEIAEKIREFGYKKRAINQKITEIIQIAKKKKEPSE